MKENEIFNFVEEGRISEAAINIPYSGKQRKIYYREDFGFKADDFILVTVGSRLKYELDIAFLETSKRALKENPRYKWIIVGNVIKNANSAYRFSIGHSYSGKCDTGKRILYRGKRDSK